MITYSEENKAFCLESTCLSYQIQVSPQGRLFQLYFGHKIGQLAPDSMPRGGHASFHVGDKGEHWTFSPSIYAQEIGFYGMGDYRVPSLRVENSLGNSVTDARYVAHRIFKGKKNPAGLPYSFCDTEEADTLEIDLLDDVTGLLVTLSYTVFAKEDIIARHMTLKNTSGQSMWLLNAKSLCLDLRGCDYDLIHLKGDWSNERMEERHALNRSIETVASGRGSSSHSHNPFIALARPDTTEEAGEVLGFALLYSGSFAAHIETNELRDTRVVMGINEEAFRWELHAGEVFETPEVITVRTEKGIGEMSRMLHRFFRKHIINPYWQKTKRPLLINSWEAAYFNFDEEKLYDFALRAKEMGIEMLVMDDGWFGKRNDDDCSLGDWVVNENKLHGGLPALVKRIHDLGMKFGIWFEPEMISPNSDLYRAHPDWSLHTPGRKQSDARQQYVLDFSNPAVVDNIWEQMKKVLDSCPIDYVKWDYNRNFSEASSDYLGKEHQGELAHRCILGTYDLQNRLVTTYPHILLENCSGGGGRFDGGMLFYSPQIWCSDNTDPIDRLFIQFGTSLCYPACTMGAHVSASDRASLKTKGAIAAWGTNGYELDPNRYSPEERELVKQQVACYHRDYDLVHNGDLYRLRRPTEGEWCAWEIVSPDKTRAMVTTVNMRKVVCKNRFLKLRGLDPDKTYRCTSDYNDANGKIYRGDALMYAGINLCYADFWDYVACEFRFEEC